MLFFNGCCVNGRGVGSMYFGIIAVLGLTIGWKNRPSKEAVSRCYLRNDHECDPPACL